MRPMKKFLILFGLIMLSSTVYAETIVLESGRTIEGEIIEKTDDYIKIRTADNDMKIKMKMLSEETKNHVNDLGDFEQQLVAPSNENKKEIAPIQLPEDQNQLIAEAQQKADKEDYKNGTLRLKYNGLVLNGEFIEKGDDYILISFPHDPENQKFLINNLTPGSKKFVEELENFSKEPTNKEPLDNNYGSLSEHYAQKDKIQAILKSWGYDAHTAFSISNILWQFESILQLGDNSNDKKILEDLNSNIETFNNLSATFYQIEGLDPDPFTLNVFYQMVGVEYEPLLKKVLSISKKNYRMVFQCNFISYLATILYKIRDFDIYGIETEEIDTKYLDNKFSDKIKEFLNIKNEKLDKQGHVLNLIKLNSGLYVVVDFLNSYISSPFDLETETYREGKYYIFKNDKFLIKRFKFMQPEMFRSYLFSNLSSVLNQLGMTNEAEIFLEKALEASPNNLSALFNKGMLAASNHQYEIVNNLAKKCISIDPYSLNGYVLSFYAYSARGEFDKAKGACEHALLIDPNNADAQRLLGYSYFNLRDKQAAKKELEKAIKLYRNYYQDSDIYVKEIEDFMKENKLDGWFNF